MKKILVTGGAGYIGSHTANTLLNKGYEPYVFDNMYQGKNKFSLKCKFVRGDLKNKNDLKKLFKLNKFAGVIHFAAYTLAGESMLKPGDYFLNNVLGGINLLEAMKDAGVNYIVFSSTCAVYGTPNKLPVSENESKKPESVYGETKLMFEKILQWYDRIFGIKNVCLRYFNAAGAELDGSNGEAHDPETHIIPVAFEAVLGKRKKFIIFGNDYKTKDGTCVRDYIHVLDLANAHINALEYLFKEKKSNAFNVGTGNGYSNKEIVDMIKKVVKKNFPVEIGGRRRGDPDIIYADNSKIKKILGWEAQYSDLETIIKSAWKWHSKKA